MGYFNAIFVWTILPIAMAAETCPPANQLTPCTCDREGVNCMSATSVDEIRKAFKANFPFKGVSKVFIQGTPLTNIPRDIFGTVASLEFYIEMNEITRVDKEAFYPSKEHLSVLSFFGNKLTNFWYNSLADFPKLTVLNLGRNKITSIPANSFSHNTLHTIFFTQNAITSIGQNAFLNLPMLMKLELTTNSLTTLGPLSLHVSSVLPSLEVFLTNNQISSISSTAFEDMKPMALHLDGNKLTTLKQEAFGSLLKRLHNDGAGGVIDVSVNPLTCRGCDYKWLMNEKTIYYEHLVGFVCPDGTGILDLTSSKIGC